MTTEPRTPVIEDPVPVIDEPALDDDTEDEEGEDEEDEKVPGPEDATATIESPEKP